MAKFQDSRGHEYEIDLKIGLAARLKKDFGLDFVAALYDVQSAYKIIGELYKELDIFCGLIHAAAKIEIPLDEFMDYMGGPEVAAAFEALDQAFTDFYPPGGPRERIARLKTEMQAGMENEQTNLMPEINAKVKTEMRGHMRKVAGLK